MQPWTRGTRTIPKKNTKATMAPHKLLRTRPPLGDGPEVYRSKKEKNLGKEGKKKRVKSQEASTDVSAMPSRLSGWGSYAPNGGRLAHT